MAEPIRSWDDAAAFALTLPDTGLSTSYGKPAVKVNGRAFLYSGREPENSFGPRDRSRHGRDAEGNRSGDLLADAAL